MKKLLSLLLAALLIMALAASAVSALELPGFPQTPIDLPKNPIDLPKDSIDLPRDLPDFPEDLPDFPEDPPIDIPGDLFDPPKIQLPPKDPDQSAPRNPRIPNIPKIPLPKIPQDTPVNPGTPKTTVPKTGKFVTSEGPLFIMYRDDLTKGYEMFTPLDLSLDREYVFPLVSNAMHTVGEVKVTVKKGLVTVHPQVFLGVNMTDRILTFFPDIRSVDTIKTDKLKKVDIPFDLPVDVAARLGIDDLVLMYINCPVSYKSNSKHIQPFSLEDPVYLERMYALIDLMD